VAKELCGTTMLRQSLRNVNVTTPGEEMISITYEEYHDSPLFGWIYIRSQTISLPADLPLKELNQSFKSVVDSWNEFDAILLTATSGFLLHFQDTILLPICSYCCCLGCCLSIFYYSLYEQKGIRIQNGSCELDGTVREIFINQRMYLRYYKPRFRRGQHDIGVWTSGDGFPGSSLLQEAEREVTTGTDNKTLTSKVFLTTLNSLSEIYSCQTQFISDLIGHHHGNVQASFHINSCPPEISLKLYLLRDLVDESYHQALLIPSRDLNDFKLTLTVKDLNDVIGEQVTSQLLHYFSHESFLESSSTSFSSPQLQRYESGPVGKEKEQGRHVDQIIVRRSAIQSQCIPFHTDFAVRTMQISLTSPGECEGGRLVYLSNDRCVLPKREVGIITIHENDIVHGVTEMLWGLRYGLFMLQKGS
jgi:hypothetical protein